MAAKIRISLVRHGLSAANLDRSVNKHVADHAVELSPEGERQAYLAGLHLAGERLDLAGEHLAREACPATAPGRTAVYVSPYARTRATWASMRRALVDALGEEEVASYRVAESIHLRELEFGLFDGIEDDDLPRVFPREHALYEKFVRTNGEYFARMPSGESRCDVAQRVHAFFGTLHRDHERHGVDHAIVVSHGVTIRCFAQMWLGHPVEWYATQRNPANCSVRTLLGGEDLGTTFAGYAPPRHSAREVREDGEVA